MNKGKLSWCRRQPKGIRLAEAKPHLSRSYMEEADETLQNFLSATGKWKTITAYYACYNALYSILMKCGIVCEIHDCTIELMGFFDFTGEEKRFMTDLKDDRIKAQYYLKKIVFGDEDKVKTFLLKCKTILNGLSSEKTESVRASIRKLS
ncbi:MAG: hypothetical protein V1813_03770 [Candidatus Aenigmatarchaeota archaeon]